MTKTNGNGGGGMAGASAVLGILALVAGVAALNQPMGLRIAQLGDLVQEMREAMRADDDREMQDARAAAALAERIRHLEQEVERLRGGG